MKSMVHFLINSYISLVIHCLKRKKKCFFRGLNVGSKVIHNFGLGIKVILCWLIQVNISSSLTFAGSK
jgi:hypothetical protein